MTVAARDRTLEPALAAGPRPPYEEGLRVPDLPPVKYAPIGTRMLGGGRCSGCARGKLATPPTGSANLEPRLERSERVDRRTHRLEEVASFLHVTTHGSRYTRGYAPCDANGGFATQDRGWGATSIARVSAGSCLPPWAYSLSSRGQSSLGAQTRPHLFDRWRDSRGARGCSTGRSSRRGGVIGRSRCCLRARRFRTSSSASRSRQTLGPN